MKTFTIITLTTMSLFGAATPLHVELDIYANKAFLKQSYEIGRHSQIVTKVPQNISLENIRYILPKMCRVDEKSLKKVEQDSLTQKSEQLSYKISALKAKSILLKTLSLKGEKDPNEIENLGNLLVEKLTANMLKIAQLKTELQDIKKAMAQNTKELKTTFRCKNYDEKVIIIYPLKNMKYTTFYNINANIPNKSVVLEKKASLFFDAQSSYENIDINIYSYRFNQSVTPQKFYPRYLGQKRDLLYAKVQKSPMMKSAPNISYSETETKSFYKIRNATLKKGEKNLLDIEKVVLDASFKSVIDGYGTNRAYLEATIKTDKNFSGGTANFFLNQNPISSRYLQKIKKDAVTKLYFGEDEHIQVQKELVKTLDEKTFFGDKKISTQNWKYTITSKKLFSTNIEFIERVPVSKDANIKVKTLALPKYNSQNANGKTIWNFNLEGGKKKEIIFGYEISKEK